MHTDRGFSLVELLVVVAVVSVLAALLFPTIEESRKVSERMLCANNLRQLYVTASDYMQSSAGWLPTHDQWAPGFAFGGACATSQMTRIPIAVWEEVFPISMRACPSIPFPAGWIPTSYPGSWRPMRYMSPAGSLYTELAYSGYRHLANTSLNCARLGLTQARAGTLNVLDRVPLFSDAIHYYSPSMFAHIAHTAAGVNGLGRDKPFVAPDGQNGVWGDGHAEWHEWPDALRDRITAVTALPQVNSGAVYRPEGWCYVGTNANSTFSWAKDRP